jgi:hypothetical protein
VIAGTLDDLRVVGEQPGMQNPVWQVKCSCKNLQTGNKSRYCTLRWRVYYQSESAGGS